MLKDFQQAYLKRKFTLSIIHSLHTICTNSTSKTLHKHCKS